jgi:hypothetical protein
MSRRDAEGSRIGESVPEMRIRLRRMPILGRKKKKLLKKMIPTCMHGGNSAELCGWGVDGRTNHWQAPVMHK